MATLFIPASLRELCGGATRMELDAATVRGLVRELDARYPGAAERLIADDAPRSGWAIAVDGVMVRSLATKLSPTAEVHFVPAVGGG
jgi:molybdopterin synthase sulfur carrier subunit